MKGPKKGACTRPKAKTQDVATPATSATGAPNEGPVGKAKTGSSPPQLEAKLGRTHIGGVPIEFLNHVKPLFDKAFRGLGHHDPVIRGTWMRHLGKRTPFETYDLIMLMTKPPGKKGRPEKSGLAEQDLQLMPEVHRRVSAGETLKAVTEALVELDHRQGGKPSVSAPVRLQRRYREWRKTQK